MIYADSCLIIYAVENAGPLGVRARTALSSGTRIAISPLVMSEVLVWPLRRNDQTLLADYRTLFEELTILDIHAEMYLRAAELRAASPGLKTVDALHLATARLSGCAAFWTNDRRLSAVAGAFAVDVTGA